MSSSKDDEALDALGKASIVGCRIGCLLLVVTMLCSAALIVFGTWKLIERMQG